MNKIQRNLCVFIHYSIHSYIPRYVKIYVDEISIYFDQVILVTNERSVEEDIACDNMKISTLFVKNEGYDLGMFYKVIQTIDISNYSQIACVNDSNILFNQLLPIFNWSKTLQADFWGLIDSNQKPWFSTHQNNYHIQSHFIVFNRKALLKLPGFFDAISIQDILKETDPVKLRQTVIDKWEIGISQFLIKEGLSCASFIDSNFYSNLYLSGKRTNVSLNLYPELIRSGFPLIKMKVITKGKLKDIFRSKSYWKNLIRQYGKQNWEIELLIDELIQIKNGSGNQPFIKIRRKFLHITQSAGSLFLKLIKKITWKKIRTIPDYHLIERFFFDKNGLEIGGPSKFFSKDGFMPVYNKMATLDNVNFSSTTIWTGKINEQAGFLINNKPVGNQYITDATDLGLLKNNSYDFILSCNNIEHIANPIKAIEQWIPLLNNGGVLVIVAPRKESNFDHNREIVKFDHLISDYTNDTKEDDMTHFEEILLLHDLKMDPPAGSREQFRERSLKNFENRCFHHHVFNLDVLTEIYDHFNLSVIKTVQLDSDYIIIGKK